MEVLHSEQTTWVVPCGHVRALEPQRITTIFGNCPAYMISVRPCPAPLRTDWWPPPPCGVVEFAVCLCAALWFGVRGLGRLGVLGIIIFFFTPLFGRRGCSAYPLADDYLLIDLVSGPTATTLSPCPKELWDRRRLLAWLQWFRCHRLGQRRDSACLDLGVSNRGPAHANPIEGRLLPIHLKQLQNRLSFLHRRFSSPPLPYLEGHGT